MNVSQIFLESISFPVTPISNLEAGSEGILLRLLHLLVVLGPQVLRHLADRSLHVVTARARSEGLLDDGVLLLSAEGTSNADARIHRRVHLHLVLLRTRVHVSLANTEVRADTRANEVRDIRMVIRDYIGLVLAWTRHVQILAHEAASVGSQMELGGLLEAIVVLVPTRTRDLDLLNHVLSLGVANREAIYVQVISLLQSRVHWIVSARASLRQVFLLDLGVVRNNFESRDRVLRNLLVSLRSGNLHVDFVASKGCLLQHRLSQLLLGCHVQVVNVVSRRSWHLHRLLVLRVRSSRRPGEAETVRGFSELGWPILGRRRVLGPAVNDATSSRSEASPLDNVQRSLAFHVLLRHLVGARAGTIDLGRPKVLLVADSAAEFGAKGEDRRRRGIDDLVGIRAERLVVLVLVDIASSLQLLLGWLLVRLEGHRSRVSKNHLFATSGAFLFEFTHKRLVVQGPQLASCGVSRLARTGHIWRRPTLPLTGSKPVFWRLLQNNLGSFVVRSRSWPFTVTGLEVCAFSETHGCADTRQHAGCLLSAWRRQAQVLNWEIGRAHV